jgi:hypothetical protein
MRRNRKDEAMFAKLTTLLRRASERSIEALWNRIGELRDLLELLGEVARDSDRGHTISDYAIIELR